MLVAFFIMRLCCWLMVRLVSTRTPTFHTRPFPVKLLSSWSAPVFTGGCGYSSPGVGFYVSYCSYSLWSSLCPFLQPATPPSVTSSANCLWVSSASLSRFFVKVKLYLCQYQPLGCTTRDRPPTELHVSDGNPLGPAVQLNFSLSHCLLI